MTSDVSPCHEATSSHKYYDVSGDEQLRYMVCDLVRQIFSTVKFQSYGCVISNVAYVHMYESSHHMACLKFQTSLSSNLAKTLSESVRIWNISIAVCSSYIYHTCRYHVPYWCNAV